MSSTFKVCRICLSTDIKLYNYHRYELKNYYEQIMSTKVYDKDALPCYFCYECAAMLHKFHKFKEKCYMGQTLLKELIWKGPETLKSVRNLKRQTKNLQSSLNIVTVNPRVRTFIIKQKGAIKLNKLDEPLVIDSESGPVSDDDGYVNDNDEIEELSPLPELIDVDTNIVDDEEKTDVDIENKDIFKEETDTATEKTDVGEAKTDIANEKITLTVPLLKEIEKDFSDSERMLSGDDENILDNNINDEKPIEKEPNVVVKKQESIKNSKKNKKGKDAQPKKKFEIGSRPKKTDLNPNNWLKVNLNEVEAVEQFKARALHKRYISAEYKCNECLKGFSKEDILKRHTKLRHSESIGPIECRFCHMRFKGKYFLSRHMKEHYTRFKCLRCDLVCPLESTAIFHEEYHNGVIRKCEHCGAEFKHVTTYYSHLRTHRSEHVCTLCGASFVSQVGLRIHQKIKHVHTVSDISEDSKAEQEYCKRCDMKFETKKAYDEHLIHSAMHVDGIKDSDVQASINTKPRKGPENMKRFNRIPTDCRICGKHFNAQAACRKHHFAEHPDTPLFSLEERQICEICGISLAPASLPSHLNTHTREKLHSCSTCGRQFNSKGGLTKHQLTHSSEKPVACKLCDKRFKQITSLALHFKTFHLKQPYPKRNRKKKTDDISKLDADTHDESDDNTPLDVYRRFVNRK